MDKEKAKKMLFDVADIIEDIGLMFFLSDGTCLGAHREHDFIDTDTDIDIKMLAEDFVPNCKRLINGFSKAGYKVNRAGDALRFTNILVVGDKLLHLDLLSLFLIDDKRWLPGKKKSLVYPARLFDTPGQIDFLGRRFYVPTPVEEYLELTYGADYMTPKVGLSYPEQTIGYVNKRIISIMEEMKE